MDITEGDKVDAKIKEVDNIINGDSIGVKDKQPDASSSEPGAFTKIAKGITNPSFLEQSFSEGFEEVTAGAREAASGFIGAEMKALEAGSNLLGGTIEGFGKLPTIVPGVDETISGTQTASNILKTGSDAIREARNDMQEWLEPEYEDKISETMGGVAKFGGELGAMALNTKVATDVLSKARIGPAARRVLGNNSKLYKALKNTNKFTNVFRSPLKQAGFPSWLKYLAVRSSVEGSIDGAIEDGKITLDDLGTEAAINAAFGGIGRLFPNQSKALSSVMDETVTRKNFEKAAKNALDNISPFLKGDAAKQAYKGSDIKHVGRIFGDTGIENLESAFMVLHDVKDKLAKSSDKTLKKIINIPAVMDGYILQQGEKIGKSLGDSYQSLYNVSDNIKNKLIKEANIDAARPIHNTIDGLMNSDTPLRVLKSGSNWGKGFRNEYANILDGKIEGLSKKQIKDKLDNVLGKGVDTAKDSFAAMKARARDEFGEYKIDPTSIFKEKKFLGKTISDWDPRTASQNTSMIDLYHGLKLTADDASHGMRRAAKKIKQSEGVMLGNKIIKNLDNIKAKTVKYSAYGDMIDAVQESFKNEIKDLGKISMNQRISTVYGLSKLAESMNGDEMLENLKKGDIFNAMIVPGVNKAINKINGKNVSIRHMVKQGGPIKQTLKKVYGGRLKAGDKSIKNIAQDMKYDIIGGKPRAEEEEKEIQDVVQNVWKSLKW